MKKVIKHPDGRVETVEGTAEEIAEYERKLREGGKTKGKKPLLGAPVVDGVPLTDDEIALVRLSRAGLLPKEDKGPTFVPVAPSLPTPWPTYHREPYWLQEATPCWVCGKMNCHELHIWCGTNLTNRLTS